VIGDGRLEGPFFGFLVLFLVETRTSALSIYTVRTLLRPCMYICRDGTPDPAFWPRSQRPRLCTSKLNYGKISSRIL